MILNLTDAEVEVMRRALDDAWYYRLGEAADLADPDLDPVDRRALVQYQALLVAHPGLGES